jgi:DNA-binding MarR family transcriptional regulator
MADRLVAKRLVLRRASDTDRRTMYLRLSSTGRRMVERVTEARRKELRTHVAQLSRVECEQIATALGRFASVAGDAAAHSWNLAWADHR